MTNAKMIIYIVVFIVCFGLAMGLLSINSLLPTAKKTVSQETSNINLTGVWMKLSAESTNVSVGDEVTFTVMADSDTADINGFDVLFEFDPQQFEIVQVNSLIPYFDLYTFDKNPTFLSITGTKKLSAETTAVIKNSALISIVARAKQAGTSQARILPDMKMEKTKMVNSKADIMIPSIGEAVTVTVN